MFIDTHVHLNNKDLNLKLEDVLKEAYLNKVNKFLVVGYDKETSYLAIEIANKLDNCYASVGYHPTEIKDYKEEDYIELEKMAKDDKVIAIGEVGYDFHWDTTTKEEQEYAFKKQIEIAKKLKLPLIIHSRDAHQITFQTLKETNAKEVGGIMHSYSGSSCLAKEYIKLNFNFGISGPVTFKNGRSMKEVVKDIDIKYLVCETDSPYLTPHPYRGEENGPKYIPLIVEEIARIKGIEIDVVAKNILDNVNRIFGGKYE